uniref:NAD(P)(+)--arginine ADP-ribosyltransferase n=1 Tax=Lates calcarifer TaxID=8187 RepID=A0A4W6FRK5_LATCA
VMKSRMLIFAPLCFILTLQDANQTIPLNMTKSAVDDMFSDCNERMEKLVNDKYFKKETKDAKFKDFYKTFNDAARTERKTYGTTFKFHSLHFCLTSAAQMLNNNKNYNITYHRTNDVFTGKVKKINQFGSFTSTSFRADLSQFGAFLKTYSQPKEQEVFIPPYEMFKITKITDTFVENLTDCKNMYFLESAGDQTNRNCHVAY